MRSFTPSSTATPCATASCSTTRSPRSGRCEARQSFGKVGRTGLDYHNFTEHADDRAIRTEFDKARKAFGADVALAYANHLAGPDDEDDDLTEAFVKASALATVSEVREKVDVEASELADHWFAEHSATIKALPDLRRAEYDTIRAQTTEPRLDELQRPRTRMEDYAPPRPRHWRFGPVAAAG